MDDDSVEVPIMLSPDVHLSYEDIAKWNPFYEEYRTFWNTSSDSASSSSTNNTSRSSSLRTFDDLDMPPSPTNLSSPELHVLNGNEYQLYYDSHKHRINSHIAVVEHDDYVEEPLSTLDESVEFYDLSSSELDLEFIDNPLAQPRTSHKQLFGENGWLGGNTDPQNVTYQPRHPKHNSIKSLGKKLKHHVGGIAEDMAKAYPKSFCQGARRVKIMPESPVPISLDPHTQAKLYSELEVMICISANRFLVQQYNVGRMSRESIRKVTNFWGSKNRPQVVEFQFDQATQRRLILSNIRTLNFNGENSTNPVLLHSNLRNWRAIVKEMNVRTFCAPDSVIRKHMHDIYKILDMLGAPISTMLAFEELQTRTLAVMKEHGERNHSMMGGCRIVV